MQGNKPDFHLAMGGEGSKALYSQVLLLAGRLVHLLQVVAGLVKGYREDRVHTGVFGADMQVHKEGRKAWLLCIVSRWS